ncbi:hypothetical protein C8Q73DRAFT_664232 [Cubamyces lactineus]|nr:hypothetical protein C8Q73DRAFT_664232 [Cubamyces lactineus]
MPNPSMGSTSTAINLSAEVQEFIRSIIRELPQPQAHPGSQPKFKDPQTLDGTKSQYEYWKHTLQQYVAGMEKDRAISLILSYMQGPAVEPWKDSVFQAKHTAEGWGFATLDVFWVEMDKIYKDPNLARTAQARLEKLRMKGLEVQEFFTELYWVSNALGINGIENNYDNWKSRVLAIVQNESIHHAIMGNLRPVPMQVTHTAQVPRAAPAPAPAPPQTQRDGTGITYGDRGQPMDLDRLCVKCRMKKKEAGMCGDVWHIPPSKKGNLLVM